MKASVTHQATTLGVDCGGTFTDFVLIKEGEFYFFKCPSTPPHFELGVLEGLNYFLKLFGEGSISTIKHGTTVATNAFLENKGETAALITTAGFKDVLAIGRQARPHLYLLEQEKPIELISRDNRYEVHERVTAKGEVLLPLDPMEVERILDGIKEKGIASLAVCLLFSFLHPQHEELIAKLAEARGLTVSLSSHIAPEFREYERTVSTALNAKVSPVLKNYLVNLEEAVQKRGVNNISVILSSGGSAPVAEVSEKGISSLLSGPAAGVMGAHLFCREIFGAGYKTITLDMGGTSTDVALLDGGWSEISRHELGGLPILSPMIDIHTVGAGGGSIAGLDPAGALVVGPKSAGANPGPACYGKSKLPTVTDANAVLGRLSEDKFCQGRIPLRLDRSQQAISALGKKLKLSPEQTAQSIVGLVNHQMARAIRKVSLEKGIDPKEYILFCFGGAGGLHACELAEQLNMKGVLIPLAPGLLCAWGAATANLLRQKSRTLSLDLNSSAWSIIEETACQMAAELNDGFNADGKTLVQVSADCRYKGQSFELNVPMEKTSEKLLKSFHQLHQKRFGHHHPQLIVELMTLRVKVSLLGKSFRLPKIKKKKQIKQLNKNNSKEICRDDCPPGTLISGPCLITEDYASTFLAPGWLAKVDDFGNLHLSRSASL